ncbi:hypothetical protein Sango_2811700 [Sesamum angolense]|uniref:Uncharacterized protein n=1 Tax=Sesamum angolense TaxID=2727404 RepID=A0AAE1W0K2_9LAMI|nr:hypothetical protein Sango_2811700 [Sesamum angolense]
MSVLQFPQGVDSSADLQIWNNAAFDNGENSEDLTANRQSWGSLKSIFGDPKASFDSVSGKENQSVVAENQVSSVSSCLKSSTTPFKPVNTDGAIEKSRIKGAFKKGFQENVVLKVEGGREIRDEKKIEEIEEIESEIMRLNSRLESLRLEKAGRSVKVVEKRGRIVPAKFMEEKQCVKYGEGKKQIEEIPSMTARTKVPRRGVSLGPAEIASGGRRGMSLGPSEIFGAVKSRQTGKLEMITPVQSRRKSCFFKMQEIDEEKVVVAAKERGKSSSLSPNSRKVAAKTQVSSRQAVTTISSRKTLKKDDALINAIQPKKLFKDGEKSVPATNKKPLRPGRVVASRYNQNTAMRKRSLPENDKDDSKRGDKKRSLSVGKSRVNPTENKNLGTESRVKKRWEIPSEIVVHGSMVEADESSPQSIVAVPDLLPRIRIARCVNESPRDSGPAKKVVELIGRKSVFGNDDEEVEEPFGNDDEEVEEPSLCQALTFAEEERRSLIEFTFQDSTMSP